ncbi:MAG: hypothetical protein ABSH38_02715 [Verrucomicrobiota bacterium]
MAAPAGHVPVFGGAGAGGDLRFQISVVPHHRQRIFLVGFKPGRAFAFPEFPAEGPKLASILDPDVPDKYTLTDHLWN